jgi:hypothetical protein
MTTRYASINDLPIAEVDRKFFWPLGRRPDDHPGLTDLGGGPSLSSLGSAFNAPIHEAAHELRDLVRCRVEREVTRLEDVHLGI